MSIELGQEGVTTKCDISIGSAGTDDDNNEMEKNSLCKRKIRRRRRKDGQGI